MRELFFKIFGEKPENNFNKIDNNLPQGKIFYFDYECNNN